MHLRHQTLTKPSPAATATGSADAASALLVMSVPAVDVNHHLHDLRSRSQAMMTCRLRADVSRFHVYTSTRVHLCFARIF